MHFHRRGVRFGKDRYLPVDVGTGSDSTRRLHRREYLFPREGFNPTKRKRVERNPRVGNFYGISGSDDGVKPCLYDRTTDGERLFVSRTKVHSFQAAAEEKRHEKRSEGALSLLHEIDESSIRKECCIASLRAVGGQRQRIIIALAMIHLPSFKCGRAGNSAGRYGTVYDQCELSVSWNKKAFP